MRTHREDDVAGLKLYRLELTVDADQEALVRALAVRLSGGAGTRSFRSEAARQLLEKGPDAFPGLRTEAGKIVKVLRAEEVRRAEEEAARKDTGDGTSQE
jgi:hypothetical protein